MQIDTRSGHFGLTNPGGNSTASSIVEPLPTGSNPKLQAAASTGVVKAGDGVIEMGQGSGGLAPNALQFVPYGAGSATNTFTMKVYGWRRTVGLGVGAPNNAGLWVPYLLASFTITLGTAPGIANTDVNASQLFNTTIALVTGNANVSTEVISPTGNVIGHMIVDVKGASFVETRYSTGASATSCNSLYAPL